MVKYRLLVWVAGEMGREGDKGTRGSRGAEGTRGTRDPHEVGIRGEGDKGENKFILQPSTFV
jgi:hypothetical protein